MASTTSSTSGREATTDTVYFQDGQQTLADYEAGTAAGSPSYTYIYADYIDEPVLRIDSSGGKLSYHRNQQYSIVALTDSTGAIVERYAYTAYGEPTILSGSGSPQPFTTHKNRYQYTGREWDEKLSLYHHRARMYSPVAGRFVSRDPISYIGSEWSLYEYVDGGPLRKVDPFGKWGISVYERDDQICGYSIWLLTGSWCSDPDLIIAATDRYDRQVECWWDCVVTTNKCACTCAANVIAASCTLGFTHIEVARQPFRGGMGAGGPITTLQSRLALWIGEWVIQDGYNDGREPGRIT